MSNYYDEKIPEQLWLETAASYVNPPEKRWKPVSERTFCSFFKLTPEGCSDLWYHLEMYWERNMNDPEALTLGQILEIHWLWVLHYLCTYASESVCAAMVGVTEKTWRKYVWGLLQVIVTAGDRMVSSCFMHILLLYHLCTHLYILCLTDHPRLEACPCQWF